MTIQNILEEYELPVCIKKNNWTEEFYFRVEKIDGQFVRGTAFKNNQEYVPTNREYKFLLSEAVLLYGSAKKKQPIIKAIDSVELESVENFKGLAKEDYIKYKPIIIGFISSETILFHPNMGEGTFVRFEKNTVLKIVIRFANNIEKDFSFPQCIDKTIFFSEKDAISGVGGTELGIEQTDIEEKNIQENINCYNAPNVSESSNNSKIELQVEEEKGTVIEKIDVGEKEKISNTSNIKSEKSNNNVTTQSCDNCMLRKNGTCTTIKKELCDDYRAIPYVSLEEKKSWPTEMSYRYEKKNWKEYDY